MTFLQVGAAPIEARWHGGWRIPGNADVFDTRDAAYSAAGVESCDEWLTLARDFCSDRDTATESPAATSPCGGTAPGVSGSPRVEAPGAPSGGWSAAGVVAADRLPQSEAAA